MTVERFVFDAAVAVAILFGGLMVVTKNPVRSVLTLVVAFFALAASYVMLLSPFIAAIQVIVYAGAILVLFLFVLMLLNIGHVPAEKGGRPIQTFLGSTRRRSLRRPAARHAARRGPQHPRALGRARGGAHATRRRSRGRSFPTTCSTSKPFRCSCSQRSSGAFVLARREPAEKLDGADKLAKPEARA